MKKHNICFSGGHSSAIVAVEVVRKYGKDSVTLLNHDINPKFEDADIKRFKAEVAEYLGLPITYANYAGITEPELIPDQFEICVNAGALTDIKTQQALCTAKLKTEPFYDYLEKNFTPESREECIIYYGFDRKEKARIQRRSSIMGAKGYKTAYLLATWKERTIYKTEEIGIRAPLAYALFEHANCYGCLKASLLHWYVVYCFYYRVYKRGIWMENEVGFTIHTIVRKGIKRTISLQELAIYFERMKNDGIPATEHQSKLKFAAMLKSYELEEVEINKPCECVI